MKHIFLCIVCVFAITSSCYGQKITLQRNGKIVGTYSGDYINVFSEAYQYAEDGDTLFISKGNYLINDTIDKSIAIIGTDASQCMLYKDYYLASVIIKPKENSTISQITIEGVTIKNDIGITTSSDSNIKNINIRKCILHGLATVGLDFIENATFESCKISGYTYIQGGAKHITFRNCEIAYCLATYSTTTLPKFINCDIINLESVKVICINCIIGQVGKGITSYLDEANILINTLYHKVADYDPAKNCLVQDCYATENEIAKDVDEWGSNNKLIITEEELLQNNYLGTDGTVVGKSGGARPYSLDMHLPSITKNKLVVDNNNKKVSINVSVTAN